MDKSLPGNRIPAYTPYVVIAAFVLLSFPFRYYIIPQWGIFTHLALVILQYTMICGIWLIIKFINRYFEKIYPFERGVIKRILFQQSITLIILVPIMAILVDKLTSYLPVHINKEFKIIILLVVILAIIVFNLLVYLGHFVKRWQHSILDNAELSVKSIMLEKEKLQLQFQQLKNQINPHFLFNTLSSLDSLIYSNPDLASEFLNHLASMYRYIVENKEKQQITIEEELKFILKYKSLLEIKFQDGISILINIPTSIMQREIITVAMQALIDNAIKHNIVQASSPLKIEIYGDANYIYVKNNLQIRKQVETSTKQGLSQLKNLYSFISDKYVEVIDNNQHFIVKLPLI